MSLIVTLAMLPLAAVVQRNATRAAVCLATAFAWSVLTAATGFVVSFLSALVVVKAFLAYVSHHSFTAFAWYRIVFGALLLWLAT